MEHVYKATEWENNGRYHIGDVSRLSANSNSWKHQAVIFSVIPDINSFGNFLKEKYHAEITPSDTLLLFHFNSLKEARVYKNELNKLARQKKYCNY